ncbi:MAG: tetratricopeptide repeat protein [Candidatus Thorarchaeota archaeon SMTZ1-45]
MSDTEKDVQRLIEDLGVNPKDSQKWHTLGVAYLSLNEAEKAEDAFQKCLKLDKNNAFAHGDLGGLYILRGKNKKAIKHLEKSVKLEPGKFEYWSALGVAYFQRGSYDDAVEAFHHCLSINPAYYDAVVSLGMTYSKMQLWEKALETLTRAEKISPNSYHALKAIAKSLRHLNRTEELEQLYHRMHMMFPKDPSFAMYLGQMTFDSGKTEEGLKYYRKAIEIDSESLIGWKILSEALGKLGRKEEAQKAHEKYKEIEDKLKRANVRLFG